MEMHKPKPIHNWREFVKEYVIIVIGVLTALAAEQAVEWWHWRGRVALARQQIADEVAYDMYAATMRVRIASCVERRLDALSLVLDGAAKSGNLPPVGDISMPPLTTWSTGVWDSVVASQTAPHFPSQQLELLSAVNKYVRNMEEGSRQEVDDWKALYPMVGPGRRLDSLSEAALRQALSRARADNRYLVTLSIQLLHYVKDIGLEYRRDREAWLTGTRQRPLISDKPTLLAPNAGLICAPIGAVPASYGQSAWAAQPSLLEKGMKTIPGLSE